MQQQQQQDVKIHSTPPDNAPKSVDSSINGQLNSPSIENVNKSDVPTSNCNSTNVQVLKRPILTSKEYEGCVGDEEQTLEMLYDYRTMDAWLVDDGCCFFY